MRDGVEAVWCGINLVTMNEKKHMFWPPQAIEKTFGEAVFIALLWAETPAPQ